MRNKSLSESTRYLAILTSGIFLLVATGCQTRLNLGPPGTIGMQRDRAVLHDPFPRDDLGPAIVGGRPRGFDIPRAETVDYQDNPFSHISLRNPRLFRRAPGTTVGLPQNFLGQGQTGQFGGQFSQPTTFGSQPGFAPQVIPQPAVQQQFFPQGSVQPGFTQPGFTQPSLTQPGFTQQTFTQPAYPLQGSSFRN